MAVGGSRYLQCAARREALHLLPFGRSALLHLFWVDLNS
jgi:hypothetical protein